MSQLRARIGFCKQLVLAGGHSDKHKDVSFLTIVGIGGLGKTALAQLVYNGPRVTSAFPSGLWTCVTDHDQEQLDVEGILHKILTSAGEKHEGSSKEWLQRKLREKITSGNYLLVLDDVWTESLNQWRIQVEFFLGSQRGSWILVTTGSYKTARIVGVGPTHELHGLSRVDRGESDGEGWVGEWT